MNMGHYKLILLLLLLFVGTIGLSQNKKEIDSLIDAFEKNKYSNLDKSLQLAQKTDSLANQENYQNVIAELNLSNIHFLLRNFSESKTYANKALAHLNNNNSIKSKIYDQLTNLEVINEQIPEALILNEKALEYAEKSTNISNKISAYLSRYNLYHYRGDTKKSIYFLNKALELNKQLNSSYFYSKIYNSKGYSFSHKNNDSVIYYYHKAIEHAKLSKNKYLEAQIKNNLGNYYLDLENLPKALKNLTQGNNLAQEVGNKEALYYSNFYLGRYYEFKIDIENNPKYYTNAFFYYDKAVNEYGASISKHYLRNAYWLLAGTYEHSGDFKKAYDYQTKYIKLNKELTEVEKAKEFDEIRTKYEVAEINSQILVLEKEQELEKTKQKWLIISGLMLIFPLALLFLFYRHRAKTQLKIRNQEKEIHLKEKEKLQKEQELVEIKALIDGQDKERNRIAKELHDGIGGQIASVNLGLSHINDTLQNEKITTLGNNLKNTFKELRLISHNLSSNNYKGKSFEVLLNELQKQYENPKQFEVEIAIFPQDCLKDIDTNTKHNLYRILQEAFANISKHAKANHVSLSFTSHDDILIILIEDDGIGFDINKAKLGIGIKNIEERIKVINGAIKVDSVINVGTTILVEIPVKKNKITNE